MKCTSIAIRSYLKKNTKQLGIKNELSERRVPLVEGRIMYIYKSVCLRLKRKGSINSEAVLSSG